MYYFKIIGSGRSGQLTIVLWLVKSMD